jgi:predicted house-cleaning NTP pyrophosphatase (Maf/HAM1 superfamily)
MLPDASMSLRRRQLLRRGKIIFNNRMSVFDCAIAKRTSEGAELMMESTLGVPQTFELRLEPTGERYVCELAWRKEKMIGVVFEHRAPR